LLALVPVIGVLFTVGSFAMASRDRLQSSDEVSNEIGVLRNLTGLHRALTSERLLTVGLARLRAWNMDATFVDDAFGVDANAMLTESRREVTRRLTALSDANVIDTAGIARSLGDLRVAGASDDADAALLATRFEAMLDRVGAAADRFMLSGVVSTAGDDSRALGASLSRMHAALDANRFGALQLSSVTDVWFADETSRQAAIVGLAEHTAQFDRAMELLRAAGDPAVDRWATVLETPEVEAFDAGVVNILTRQVEPDTTIGIDRIVDTFSGAVTRQDALSELVDITSSEAEQQARNVRENAADELRVLVIVGLVVIGLTTVLAVWSAYSIALPLRRLIERTERLRDGDLAPDDPPTSGPHDLRRAAATVEQLVENLRLLDAKSVALARRDLDDPVLEAQLPGRFGQSLQASTRVLRESIAAREELQERLWHAANHDSLTGIANRSAAIEQLREALAESSPTPHVAVLFVDLDDFKRANDAHGHAAGDEILRVTAQRMRDVVRPSDIVGRLGGDEFVVGLPGVSDVGAARALAERLLRAVQAPVEVNGVAIGVGASVGVALGARGERPSEVMARADIAVYQAKQRSSGIHVYDDELHHEVQTRTSLERDLAQALQRDDELRLVHQPIVDAYTGEVLRTEALLRWNRPGHGEVAPDEFIPAAERTSLIIDVDRWVFARAMAEAAEIGAAAPDDLIGVAINVSGRHVLSDRLVDSVNEALESTGIDPALVTIEMTESVLVDDLERAAANLRAVRELGVGVYIDDFGTGYTSIAHLGALPIDGIKIDRSFVGALPRPRELTLVRTLVELGVQLGLTVVAEGVETDEQRAIVASLGCEAIQGYLVGRPCPVGQVAERLSEGSPPFVQRLGAVR
jgi:diguanylate cyclase (GGDEF)-like protein